MLTFRLRVGLVVKPRNLKDSKDLFAAWTGQVALITLITTIHISLSIIAQNARSGMWYYRSCATLFLAFKLVVMSVLGIMSRAILIWKNS